MYSAGAYACPNLCGWVCIDTEDGIGSAVHLYSIFLVKTHCGTLMQPICRQPSVKIDALPSSMLPIALCEQVAPSLWILAASPTSQPLTSP